MKLSRREWTRLLGQGVGAWVGCWMYGHFSPAIVRAAVTVQALWNVGTDFVLVPFAVISYALGDEGGAHEAIAA